MTTIAMQSKEDFRDVLSAPGRSPEIPESADAYGWLVGSWELDVLHCWVDLRGKGIKGEAHFGWVLEGRAVQDVWIVPPRSQRATNMGNELNTCGTTLRVWDPAIQAWRVTWINPVAGARAELIARWQGKDVVQIGTRGDGTVIRWIFTEITPDSFHWIGEALQPDGNTWKLEGEFCARRMR